MKVDRAKALGFILYVSAAAACRTSGRETATPAAQIPGPMRLASPQRCAVNAESIRPRNLDRGAVTTFPGMVLVNQAGSIADIAVNYPNLTRINNDPNLGLQVPGMTSIIYLFSGSFYREDAMSQIEAFYQAQKNYLSARYCEEQGMALDRVLRLNLSLADAIAETTSARIDEIEHELGVNYIIGARFTIDQTKLPQELVDRALRDGVPFSLVRLTRTLPII